MHAIDSPVQAPHADVRHRADDGADGGAGGALHACLEGVQRVHHEGGCARRNPPGQRRSHQQLPRLVLLRGGACASEPCHKGNQVQAAMRRACASLLSHWALLSITSGYGSQERLTRRA